MAASGANTGSTSVSVRARDAVATRPEALCLETTPEQASHKPLRFLFRIGVSYA